VAVSSTRDGDLLPVKVDADQGRILVTLPRPDAEGISGRFLYTTAIRSGLGSAPSASIAACWAPRRCWPSGGWAKRWR
jgi:hypothetical protein